METKFFGKNLFKLQKIDSTNKFAIELIPKIDPIEGAVVWAMEQEKGRGRQNNTWESESGKNLTFSVILYPRFLNVEDQFYISKAMSLGVFDYILQYSDNVSIKWPNDIYVGNKKIAGILIENSVYKDIIKSSVVGIGLNVNQTVFKSNAPNPTSLKLILKNDIDLNESFENLCMHLEKRYVQLQNKQFEIIDKDYLNNLFRFGKTSKFISKNKEFSGKIIDVLKTGELIILDENNNKKQFDINDINFVI
ncbi:MAG: biotin--[acetyl-CoA-carboxylase] ligase [Marinilabiliales bacterium]